MASAEGVQKKKRAWRKPREAVGPGVLLETSSEAKPPKLARISHREPEQGNTPIASPKGDDTMDTSETQASAAGGASGDGGGSSNGMRNRDETGEGGLERRHEEGGGAALSTSSSSEASSAAATTVIEIDGSVLEGVSWNLPLCMLACV